MAEPAPSARIAPSGSPGAATALALCRTPFQAAMLAKVLGAERIARYDLVYFTHDDSEEDRWYFDRLSRSAERSQYLLVPRQRFSILNHVAGWRRLDPALLAERYDVVLVASLDNLAFRKLATRHGDAELVTFDDGTVNIDLRRQWLLRPPGLRPRAYDLAFGVPSARRFAARSARHYSAYPAFENVMPRAKLRHVAPFDLGGPRPRDGERTRFFIGQPFHEYRTPAYPSRLAAYARGLELDYYVRHPRERSPLLPEVPVLPKGGRVAEDAILAACGGRRPALFGGFTGVLLNIGADVADKTMLLRAGEPGDAYLAELGARAGCEVILL